MINAAVPVLYFVVNVMPNAAHISETTSTNRQSETFLSQMVSKCFKSFKLVSIGPR